MKPLVSIIVRTCNRPYFLRRALNSILGQSYQEIQIVIVEDGKNHSEEMIHLEYQSANIKYCSTGEQLGRCKAGNIAMRLADGKYLNFLDDDDLLYPLHVETMVNALEQEKCMVVYGTAKEIHYRIKMQSEPMIIEKRSFVRYNQDFNRLLLAFHNYIPIQSAMFAREVFASLGGLDEDLDFFEDWEMWVRYSTVTDFFHIPLITSAYFVPHKMKGQIEREKIFRESYNMVVEKFKNYHIDIDVFNINREMQYAMLDYKTSKIRKILRKIKRKLLFDME